MDPAIKAAAECAAKADRRSLTGLIEILLRDYCVRNGFLDERKQKQTETSGEDLDGTAR
jgi:hypothetical protein